MEELRRDVNALLGDVGDLKVDMWKGRGRDNPSVTQRLADLESDLRGIKEDFKRHALILDGEQGLDRVVRRFLAKQEGRDQADALFRWALGIGIPALVAILEWHPWRG